MKLNKFGIFLRSGFTNESASIFANIIFFGSSLLFEKFNHVFKVFLLHQTFSSCGHFIFICRTVQRYGIIKYRIESKESLGSILFVESISSHSAHSTGSINGNTAIVKSPKNYTIYFSIVFKKWITRVVASAQRYVQNICFRIINIDRCLSMCVKRRIVGTYSSILPSVFNGINFKFVSREIKRCSRSC